MQSNCVSIQPVETEFGRKRRIDQSSCNKDFSCINGFCPSFVTVHGAVMKKSEGVDKTIDPLDGVPEPDTISVEKDGWAAVIDGVGGTGVVTIGALLGMAAHLEGKGCGIIDMAGLAQKGGAVFSHMRIAKSPEHIHSIRVSAGKADLVLGCDLVVSGAKKVLASVREGHTLFVANTAEVMPGDFARSAEFSLPIERLKRAIRTAAGEELAHFFDATRTASILFGSTVASNVFMLGFACQHGGLPVSASAIEKAVELNGQAVDMNIKAFRWGRRAAHEPEHVRKLVETNRVSLDDRNISQSLEEMIDRRVEYLTAYQNAEYADRFRIQIDRICEIEKALGGKSQPLAETVARNLFKAMAIKDEYEVARLYTDGSFSDQLANQFSRWDRLEFHLAPPVLNRKNREGQPRKSSFGPWMMKAFRVLASLKSLRGGPFDVFGYTSERKFERQLLDEYLDDLALIAGNLNEQRLQTAIELATIPAKIRGFGHIKQANARTAREERTVLRKRMAEKSEDRPVREAAE